jgi:outer membrane protein assembly factor BamB
MAVVTARARRLIPALTVLTLALTGIVLPAAAQADCADGGGTGGDWPVFAHDVTATSFQSDEDTIGRDNVADLEVAWVAPLAGTVEAPAVAAGGCVFVGTESGEVYALDITDGSLVWFYDDLSTATTLSIANGRVFVQDGSVVIALDQSTGLLEWRRDLSPYTSIGSPLAAENFVIVGMTGCGDFGSRPQPCRGYYALLDQDTGEIIVDGHDVSEEDIARGMEGPGFWSRPSYDPEDKFIYFGTANVRSIAPENPYANALLKIDADPTRETYGQIVGHFKNLPPNPIHDYPGGQELCGPSPWGAAVAVVCIDDDDFPATAVIYRDSDGNKRLGATHSGADLPLRTFASYLVPVGNFFGIDPDTMEAAWAAPTTGARSGVAAYDGDRLFFASGWDGGLKAADADDGTVLWETNALGPNVWQNVSAANGVVYTPSGAWGTLIPRRPGAAMLMALDAETGETLLQRPMSMDVEDAAYGTIAAGVTIARNTVIIPTNALNNPGYLIAYRLPG